MFCQGHTDSKTYTDFSYIIDTKHIVTVIFLRGEQHRQVVRLVACARWLPLAVDKDIFQQTNLTKIGQKMCFWPPVYAFRTPLCLGNLYFTKYPSLSE